MNCLAAEKVLELLLCLQPTQGMGISLLSKHVLCGVHHKPSGFKSRGLLHTHKFSLYVRPSTAETQGDREPCEELSGVYGNREIVER